MPRRLALQGRSARGAGAAAGPRAAPPPAPGAAAASTSTSGRGPGAGPAPRLGRGGGRLGRAGAAAGGAGASGEYDAGPPGAGPADAFGGLLQPFGSSAPAKKKKKERVYEHGGVRYETEAKRAKVAWVHQMLTEAPDEAGVLRLVEDHAEDFDARAAARALAWLAKFRGAKRGAWGQPQHDPAYPAYRRLQELVGARLGAMAPEELCALAVANDRLHEAAPYVARLGQRINAAVPRHADALGSDALIRLLFSMVRLRAEPSETLLRVLGERTGDPAVLRGLGAEDTARLAWSFGRLRHRPPAAWVAQFERHALSLAFGLNLMQISKILFAYSRFGLPIGPELFAALQFQIREKATRGNDLVASLFTNLSKLPCRPERATVEALADALGNDVMEVCESGDTMAISNFLWACARLQYRAAPAQWHRMERAFVETGIVAQMKDQELCITLWALAKLRRAPGPRLLRDFEEAALGAVGAFSARDLSTLVHAYATLGHRPSAELLAGIEEAVARQAGRCQPRQLANIMWAWAKLGHAPAAATLERLTRAAVPLLAKFNGQNLSNLLWAFASMEHHPGAAFLAAFERATVRKLPKSSAQAHANIFWSFAHLGHTPGADLLDVSDEVMTVKIATYSTFNISHIVWAYAKLEHVPDRPLLEKCDEALATRLEEFNSQDFSQVLWGLTKMAYRLEPGLLARIEQAFVRTVDSATDQDVALVMWAFARSGADLSAGTVQRLLAVVEARFDRGRFDRLSFTHLLFATGRMGRDVDEFYLKYERELLAGDALDIETACKLMYCCSLHDLCPSGEVIELCEGAIDADMGALDPGRLLGLLKSYEDLGLIMDPELRTRLVAEINAKEERAEAGDLALEETIFN